MDTSLRHNLLPGSSSGEAGKESDVVATGWSCSMRHVRLTLLSMAAGLAMASWSVGDLTPSQHRLAAAPAPLAAAERPAPPGDAVAVVQRLLTAWEEGKLNTAADIAPYVTHDLITDTTGPNLPGFQVYNGAGGLMAEVESFNSYLETKTMKQALFPGPTQDTAYWTWDMAGIASSSGKAVRVTGLDLFRVADGRVSYIKVYYDDEKAMEKLLGKPDAVSTIESVVYAWTSGKLYDPSAAAAYLTKDCIVDDTRGPDLPGFKIYEGIDGVIAWAKYFDSVLETTGLKWSLSPGPNSESAYWYYDITGIAKASGREVRLTGFDLFEVSNGKVSKIMVYWDDPKAATAAMTG